MFGLTKLRIVEIGVALLLTLAALLFVGLTVWAAEIARIEVADAWARPTIGQGKTSAAYMTIANKSDTGDLLKSARTPKAKSVELHQTTMTRRRRDADAQSRRAPFRSRPARRSC